MTRRLLVIAMCLPFVGLCVYDLWHGKTRTGVISGLFAVCNFLIYWR